MWLRDKCILVVDDTPAIRIFLKLSLEAMHAELHEAATAAEAVQKFNLLRPEVVVLDLGLPDRDGLTVLDAMRRKTEPNGYSPVIIILSVRSDHAMVARALAAGADAYLTKPFLMEDLLAEIEKQLALLTPPLGSSSGASQPA